MPVKSVKQDVSDAINNLNALLRRDFGFNYSISILADECLVARGGRLLSVTPPVERGKMEPTSVNITTRQGNTLQVKYDGKKAIAVDLIHKSNRGGVRIVCTDMDEKKLLKHCK
jgi:hypothetical protein